MTEPTDDELDAVLCNRWLAFSMQATLVRVWVRAAMRDALAKWGTQPAVAGEPVFAFRRKGFDDFCTCTEERYAELSAKPNLFETRIFYTTPPTQAADSVLEDAALPMQPICVASDGVVRFKKNRMINDMYEFSQPRGFGLNEMARGDYTQEERMQFAQLIGYSVSGYGSLSYASSESVEKADAIADLLIAARKQGANHD